jgi:2-polyprenyl-6-methoxyphenol hydroxylase-like FAD-dependent oxidoreductase
MQGSVLGKSDMARNAKEKTGYGYMRIKRTDLQDVLLEAVHREGIPIQFDKRLTAIDDNDDEDGVKVAFADGTVDEADILLGCDGIHSAVRHLHVDPSQSPEYSGMSSLGSMIPAATLPESVSSQIRGMNATLTQQGMFFATTCTASDDEIMWGFSKEVTLPASGDARDGWEVRRKEEVEGFKTTLLDLLKTACGEWGSAMRHIVEKTSVVGFYPIYKLPLGGTWFKGRCLLLGDAAHAMPPHAGQGVAMALEDAFLIARLLGDENRRPLSEVFGKFDMIRRPRVDEISIRAGKNGSIRRNTGPWALWLKELGIRVVMSGAWVLGLDRWGSEEKHMVYDVEEEAL